MARVRKAVVAGLLAALSALVPVLMGGSTHITRDALLAVVAAGVAGVVVYLTPNAAAPAASNKG